MKLKVMKRKHSLLLKMFTIKKGSLFKNIQVPFSDGHTAINVVTDLKEAYDTQCDSLISDFEKYFSCHH